MPKVSVVVATYRQEESLKKALQSLAEQTYDDFEVVLVDDNGVEEWNARIKNIVDEFTVNNPKVDIKLLVNNPNQGSARTRNRGISFASGEFVTFLDDDDVYLPNKILNQVTKMSQEDADYGLTDLCLYSESGKLIDKRIRKYIKNTDSKSLMEYHYMFHMTGTDSMMFKKNYLEGIGGFNEQDLGDEFYLMQKAIAGEGKFCYVPVCDIKAVVHVGENGLSSGQNKIKCEEMMYEHKKEYFPNLSKKARRYIKMRHYAVLAFAGLRMKKFGYTLKNGFASFFTAPIACIKLIIGRKI